MTTSIEKKNKVITQCDIPPRPENTVAQHKKKSLPYSTKETSTILISIACAVIASQWEKN